jgi:hypothetical protein
MVGLALLSGARRGELFAFRWKDFDEANRCLHVDEAVYEGTFDTPMTEASMRKIPLSETGLCSTNVCSIGTHWRRLECARQCAQTRSRNGRWGANANQRFNKNGPEIVNFRPVLESPLALANRRLQSLGHLTTQAKCN